MRYQNQLLLYKILYINCKINDIIGMFEEKLSNYTINNSKIY